MFHLAAAKSSTVLSYIYIGADIDRGAALVPQMHIVFIEESDSRIWFLWFMRPGLTPATYFYLRWICPESEPHSSCVRPHLSPSPRTISGTDKNQSIKEYWVFPGTFVIATTKFQPICRQVRQLFQMLVSPLLFVSLSWSTCLPLYSSLLRLLPHSLSLPCKNQWLLIDLGHDWGSVSFLFSPAKKRRVLITEKVFSLFCTMLLLASSTSSNEASAFELQTFPYDERTLASFHSGQKKQDSKHGCERGCISETFILFSHCPIGVNIVS